ncbi:flavin reductase family protein [Burkholderiaceae bacterium FT117]|uniref:flavin reductase family protein n=1 Tax=Zeimonas sediminis TaxID=2944268 RepID=UPI002342F460|nr:flavin reductase family protein [Zeimonas sediminis]MCM5569294.1 flavin reductase family protein [Zeimonas sediminis]
MSRTKEALPLADAYGLLEPGPVVLLATAHKGRRNVMTMSWHTMMEFEPPLVGCVVARSHYSHELLRAGRACTINIPSTALADAVVGCGNTLGSEIDKFAEFGLRTSPASLVQAPLIDACHANLECRIADTKMVASYDFFVLEVVAAWIDPRRRNARTLHHRGWGAFMKAGPTVQLASRMR